MNIGRRASQLIKLRQEIRNDEANLNEKKQRYSRMEADTIAEMVETESTAVKTTAGTISLIQEVLPQIEDFNVFTAYVSRTRQFELMHRRVSVAAFRELMDKKRPPSLEKMGLKTFNRSRLSVRVPTKKVA